MGKRIYLDCASVHTYLEQEYGLDIESVWQPNNIADRYAFKANTVMDFPDGTTIAIDTRKEVSYHGIPVEIITWKQVPSDYYKTKQPVEGEE